MRGEDVWGGVGWGVRGVGSRVCVDNMAAGTHLPTRLDLRRSLARSGDGFMLAAHAASNPTGPSFEDLLGSVRCPMSGKEVLARIPRPPPVSCAAVGPSRLCAVSLSAACPGALASLDWDRTAQPCPIHTGERVFRLPKASATIAPNAPATPNLTNSARQHVAPCADRKSLNSQTVPALPPAAIPTP